MKFIKIITIATQVCIIILAVLLVFQFSFRQINESRFSALEERLNAKMGENQKYLNEKITTLSDNLNAYQNHREMRAQYFSQRLDVLEKAYGKTLSLGETVSENLMKPPEDVTPIIDFRKLLDGNLAYTEGRLNKLNSIVDSRTSEFQSRIGVLESRVKILENENKTLKSEAKTINNNNSNAIINMASPMY